MNGMLAEGLTALIAGMGTVFIILIIISLVIGAFKYIVPNQSAGSKTEISKKTQPKREQGLKSGSELIDDQAQAEENRKIVAAITVALAASLNTDVDNLVVRSIRRV